MTATSVKNWAREPSAQIALDAESLKDVSYSLSQLSATLQKCVSCHTMYQIQGPALDARH